MTRHNLLRAARIAFVLVVIAVFVAVAVRNTNQLRHVSLHVVPVADRHAHCEENESGGKNQEIWCEQEPNPADETVEKTIRVAQPHPLVQEIPLNSSSHPFS